MIRPAVLLGFIFGFGAIMLNIYLILPLKNQAMGVVLSSGWLFFNILFAILFTKKVNGYSLSMPQGIKAAVQSGIIHACLYFISLFIIQNYIAVGFFPGLDSWRQYILVFNINLILFSLFSLIFGFITSALLSTRTRT